MIYPKKTRILINRARNTNKIGQIEKDQKERKIISILIMMMRMINKKKHILVLKKDKANNQEKMIYMIKMKSQKTKYNQIKKI